MQCQGVTLVPIYGHPTEKFVIRDEYTHAGAEQECKTHSLTLAKEAQPTHRITECLKRLGQKVSSTTNVLNQIYVLDDCFENHCKLMWRRSNGNMYIYYTKNIQYKGSTLAVCEKGKTHLVPHILHYFRTILTLLSQLHSLCMIGKEAN